MAGSAVTVLLPVWTTRTSVAVTWKCFMLPLIMGMTVPPSVDGPR
ncbi:MULTISPECIES: hypothetical protein [Streptomyces]|nr:MULTISPECIES: hypothetical protein [Streptomyces]